MKNLKQFLINLAIGFAALNLFGWAFCRGESFKVPTPQTVVITVPFSVP